MHGHPVKNAELESDEVLADGAEKFNRAAFNVLFYFPRRNRALIWSQMAEIVRIVARTMRVRTIDCLDDMKSEALQVAMEIVDSRKYDPRRTSAFSYFYVIIKNHMCGMVKRMAKENDFLDADGQIELHDVASIDPNEAIRHARSNCPNNWESFEIGRELTPQGRLKLEKYFGVCIARAQKLYPDSPERRKNDSLAERTTARIIVQVMRQNRRALLGR